MSVPGEIMCLCQVRSGVSVPGEISVSVPGEIRCLCQVRSGVCAR